MDVLSLCVLCLFKLFEWLNDVSLQGICQFPALQGLMVAVGLKRLIELFKLPICLPQCSYVVSKEGFLAEDRSSRALAYANSACSLRLNSVTDSCTALRRSSPSLCNISKNSYKLFNIFHVAYLMRGEE